MITLSTFVAYIVASWAVVVPNLYDAHGWGLRVERLTTGPYIVGETYENIRVKITLINKTEQARQYPPLGLALRSSELHVGLKYPDGRGVRCHFEPDGPTRPETWVKLEAGKSVSIELALRTFGYRQLFEPGKYQAQLTFKTPQGEVAAFPWVLDVVKPDAADILASHTVPLDELEAKRKPDDQYRAFVQQVKLGDRVFLFYRSFWGGTKNGDRVDRCLRLAELPGKVEMKVEGEYGMGKRLTITYDDKKSPTGKRIIIIDSRGGSIDLAPQPPPDDPNDRIAPPPRPGKP
ncbi:MAG: hypothetical protein L0241_31975 [Planctomycetia bacterium]|nr:hypothetical protein [Planctomycetia bacterium]